MLRRRTAARCAGALPIRGASRPISTTARAWRCDRRGQRREVLALAVAAQDHTSLRSKPRPVQRRDGGADVGALAVVEVLDVVDDGHRFDAVRLAAVFAQAVQHRPRWQPAAVGQRQCGQRVGGVVAAADAQRVGRHQALQGDLDLFVLARLMVSSASCARTSQAMPLTTSSRSRRLVSATRRRR
jgi:hypothetical protein